MRPSATITAGRSVGTSSSQFGSVKSAPMLWALVGCGSTCRRNGDDLGEVDVVPVDGGRRVDAEHPVVQAGAQIKHDCVRVEDDEPAHELVKSFGPYCDVEDLGLWVLELGGQLGESGVGRSRYRVRISSAMVSPRKGIRQAAVERPSAQREEQAFLRRREGRKRDAHVVESSFAWGGRAVAHASKDVLASDGRTPSASHGFPGGSGEAEPICLVVTVSFPTLACDSQASPRLWLDLRRVDGGARQVNAPVVDKRQDGGHPRGHAAHLFGLLGWHLSEKGLGQLPEAARET